MKESASDGDALAHAARKSADQRVAAVEEAEFMQEGFGACGGLIDILQAREEDEIFFGGEFVVDHGAVGYVAGANSVGSGGVWKRECAGGRTNEARGDAEKSGLA